jgi:hypothetical protein
MDTLTFIATITALATLIGAISPIIVALIQASKDKQQNNVLLPPNVVLKPKTKINWLIVFFFAIFSGIIGFGGAKAIRYESSTTPISEVIDPNAVSAKNTPTETTAPQANTILPQDSLVLFSEDFEDGKAQKVSSILGDWQVISDETGNKVYDIASPKGNFYPTIKFGTISWDNYIIEYRFKFVGNGDNWTSVGFRRNQTGLALYLVPFSENGITLLYTDTAGKWFELVNRSYSIEKDTWHQIRVEANGENIDIYIDEKTTITTTDTLYKSGSAELTVGPNTHMQFDDIIVMSIKK